MSEERLGLNKSETARLILNGLSPAQISATVAKEKFALVTAGAGAGKTRVLISRILWQINEGVEPRKILAVTFTNDATAEMKERLSQNFADLQFAFRDKPTICTFHSLALRILTDFDEDFKIIGDDEAYRLWLKANGKKAAKAKREIEILKGKGVSSAQEYAAMNPNQNTLECWLRYEQALAGKVDFNDLLLIFAERLQTREFRENIQNYFSVLMVDEFQDLNPVQHNIIRLFTHNHQTLESLWVCGDERQTIYEFRGSVVGAFKTFLDEYEGTPYNLGENFRSQGKIVDVSARFIAGNNDGIATAIYPVKPETNDVVLNLVNSGEEELAFIVDQTKFALRNNESVFILARDNKSLETIKETLNANAVETSRQSQEVWWQSAEVAKIVNLFRAANNPHEQQDALIELIPVSQMGVIKAVKAMSTETNISFWEALCSHAKNGQNEKMIWLVKAISAISDRLWRGNYALAFTEALEQSGWLNTLTKSVDNTASLIDTGIRLKTITEDLAVINPEEVLPGQLPTILWDLFRQATSDAKVELLTVHASKGLQRGTVIVVGLDKFQGRTDEETNTERRLIYVALTRAEQKCLVVGKDSPFFNELHNSGAKFVSEL